ncbi:MAG: fumarylacetoacetate hydrolase family protein [Alphaproteobacteria bacterium]
MMDAADVGRAAQTLYDSRQQRTPLKNLPAELSPPTLDDAYAIQDRLRDLYTATGAGSLVGWKVALTTPVMQQLVGVDHPCEGGILYSSMHTSPAEVAADAYQRIAVEAEIAVRLGRDVTDAGQTRESIADAVDACMAAIEIVDDQDADYDNLNAGNLIAGNSWNAGCVLGPAVTNWRDLDLAAVAGTMRINGKVVGEGKGADVMGHPMTALAWLANNLVRRGLPLRAGQIVMTGSVVRTEWPKAGDEVVSTMAGLGEAVLRIA